MDLATGRLITWAKVTACIMAHLVIEPVEAIAYKEGYMSLKFFNRKREIMLLESADLIAGVGGVVDIV